MGHGYANLSFVTISGKHIPCRTTYSRRQSCVLGAPVAPVTLIERLPPGQARSRAVAPRDFRAARCYPVRMAGSSTSKPCSLSFPQ
eukprot:3572823-Pyramimonas_sp.AAC.1